MKYKSSHHRKDSFLLEGKKERYFSDSMSFEQAKMIAKAAVDLDRANRHHEALQYYIDASQMLIELARTEKDDLRRNAYVEVKNVLSKDRVIDSHKLS